MRVSSDELEISTPEFNQSHEFSVKPFRLTCRSSFIYQAATWVLRFVQIRFVTPAGC